MDMEMADGAMCSRRAASLMVPVSAATTKCRTWRRVIEGLRLIFTLSILLTTMSRNRHLLDAIRLAMMKETAAGDGASELTAAAAAPSPESDVT